MALVILALVASFVPSILMYFYLRNTRKDDKEFGKECGKTLLRGVLCSVGVLLLGIPIKVLWNATGLGKKSWIIEEAFTCFVMNAGLEEFTKFMAGNKAIRNRKDTISRLDVIAFLAISAIGFGLIEDVVYCLQTNIGQILVRGILLGHVGYGLFMGLMYGKGLKENKTLYKVLAFLVPYLFHAFYNFLLDDRMPDWSGVAVFGIVLVETIFIIWMIFRIRKMKQDPEYTEPIYPQE